MLYSLADESSRKIKCADWYSYIHLFGQYSLPESRSKPHMLSNLKFNISFMANLYPCTAEIEAVKDKHVYLFFLNTV